MAAFVSTISGENIGWFPPESSAIPIPRVDGCIISESLVKRLGDTKAGDNEGMFEGMQNAQQRFKRLNNLETIATFKKLAALHALKKEYVTAKDYYEKALTASKLTSGEDDVKTLEIIDLIKQLPL